MFKSKCSNCGRKMEKEFSFCPFCGSNFRREKEAKDYGMLGIDDEIDENTNLNMPFGFEKIINSLMKELDGQMRKVQSEANFKEAKEKPIKSNGISISISTGENGKQPEIKIAGFGPDFVGIKQREGQPEKKLPRIQLSEEQEKKFAILPRKEAIARMKRFANKLSYEIDLPGVKNIKDVLINKLENSIEIKALSEEEIYFKMLPINLPIEGYALKEGKLFLDLKAN